MLQPTADKRLRVELEFMGNDDLGLCKLPWEYLCYQDDKGDWEFISTVAELVLTRYLEPAQNAQKLIVALDDKKISVLVVVLNPDPDPPPDGLGDLSAVEKDVLDQLEKLKNHLHQHRLEVVVQKVDKAVTWERFKETIANPECRPHILHLIAHGRFGVEKSRCGQIAFHLHDEAHSIEVGIEGGNIDWQSDTNFVNAFAAVNKLPRFAFLHMCEGGAIDKQDSSAGVALCLAQKGVPAVVAMQHPIEINTSTVFSKVFYEALVAGQTIDEAVQLGRASIAEQYADNRAFGTPVLYLSTRSDSILPTIPKRVRGIHDKFVRITIVEYQEHLFPIFMQYISEGQLESKDMASLEQQLRKLVNNPSNEFVSVLDEEFKGYNAFDDVGRKLAELCGKLRAKIIELTRAS